LSNASEHSGQALEKVGKKYLFVLNGLS
jgi:hypothetical protein